MKISDVRICPACGKSQIKVVASRETNKGLERRRFCMDCHFTFKTIEILEEDIKNIDSQLEKAKEERKLSELDQILKGYYGR